MCFNVFFLNQVLFRNHTPSLQHGGSSKISQPDIRGKYLWYSVKVSKALGGSALIKLDPSMDPMFWWYKTRFFSVGLFKEFVEKHYIYLEATSFFSNQVTIGLLMGLLDLVTFPIWAGEFGIPFWWAYPDGNPGFQWFQTSQVTSREGMVRWFIWSSFGFTFDID